MKRQRLKKIILVGVISISIALGSIGVFIIDKSPIARLLIRDVVVASIAHQKAGERISIEIEYDEFMAGTLASMHRTYSNSPWMLRYSQIIVPFFESESIRETAVYPKEVILEPVEYKESFVLMGLACYETKTIIIFFDERIDTRQLLPVLVHEHVHLQGGRFIDAVPSWIDVIVFEANTQAATLEVLAAMCDSGDDLACAAFWTEVKGYAEATFWVHLQQIGLEEWYEPIAKLFWVDVTDFQDAPSKLVCSYLQYPWDQIIVPGIMGESLDTGNLYNYEISDGNFVCKRLLMPFDDTEYLLGLLDQFIEWITPD